MRLYEETDDITGAWLRSQMSGAAIASVAVGKTVGVAPEADLYYVATVCGGHGKDYNDFSYLARSIRRTLQVNEQLPKERRIRVIAITKTKGWSEEVTGYEDITKAVQEAKAAGMLVICSSVEKVHGFRFQGLGRSVLADPDSLKSYGPGLSWAKSLYSKEGKAKEYYSGRLFVPADSRTTASPCSSDEYAFYRYGGLSWAIPYIAGVYALAAQAEPDVTPEKFWTLAMQTGRTVELNYDGETMPLGPIIDPVALIGTLQKK